MSLHQVPDVPVWSAVLDHLLTDDRVTPQLHGFLNLAVPQGVMGGIPGGVPGGAGGGVLGGIIGGLPAAPPPPPPPPPKEAPKPLRVGGNVQSANLIFHPNPVYPPLAKTARVQGTVKCDAKISTAGTIEELACNEGPPLLRQAAMDAIKQWKYKPTLLNNEPVEVLTTIDVTFSLN